MLTKPASQLAVYNAQGKEFYITPHPKAPHFTNAKDAQLLLNQLTAEASSPNFAPNEEALMLLRELGLVQLWFCEKYIFGAYGPFGDLNDTLHLEMCNWRQSAYCMDLGSHFMALLTRGFFKTTTLTTGADAWEGMRNGNIKIGLTNAVEDIAQGMKKTIHRIYDGNELFAILYPEMAIPKGSKDLIFGHRSKHLDLPSITVLSLGKAAESKHFDLLDIDDPIGLEDLSSGREMGSTVEKKKAWYNTNHKALLMSWHDSRIGVKATRYGAGDFVQPFCDNVKTLNGYYDEDEFDVRPEGGEWNVYYRLPVENGLAILPEVANQVSLADLEKKDYWSYATQAMNKASATGLNEFAGYKAHDCVLFASDGGYFVKKYFDKERQEESGRKYELVNLKDCDVVMGTDLAGDSAGSSFQMCKTALVIWAMDKSQDVMCIWDSYGKFPILHTFKEIIRGYKMFQPYLRNILIEKNAMQTIVKPLLSQYSFLTEGLAMPLDEVYAGTNKAGRIRVGVGQPLMLGRIYLEERIGQHFRDEAKSFPLEKFKLDYLDASDKALRKLFVMPDNIPGDYFTDDDEEEYSLVVNPVSGY